MTVAQVKLFSYGIDRARGDVPIFATAAAEAAAAAGNGSVTPSLTFTQVKVRRDPYPQTIEVSISETSMDTLELCDVAVIIIGNKNRWYWVTGYQEVTNSAYPNGTTNRMNVAISLEYIPVMTGLTFQSYADIVPERIPSATARIKQNWTQSIMQKATPAVAIPKIPCKLPSIKLGGQDTKVGWCTVYYSSNNTYSDIVGAGFFIPIDDKLNHLGDAAFLAVDTTSPPKYYISQKTLFDDDLLKFLTTSTDIKTISINVSEFCPYEWETGTYDTNNDYIRLKNNSGSAAYQTEVTKGGLTYCSYTLFAGIANFRPAITSAPKQLTGTFQLTPDAFELGNGQYVILDSFKNKVAVIPREMMTGNITVQYWTFSVLEGTYTILKINDMIVTLKSTAYPWTTSSWVEYRNFNMQYDRQALQNNIDMANRDMEIGLTDSAVNGIVGGLIGGALTGGGAAGAAVGAGTGLSSFLGGALTSNMRREQQIDKLRRDQQLTEQRMKNGPITLNNFAAGLNFSEMVTILGGAEIILEMPADLSSTQYFNQVDLWGHPADKIRATLILKKGYWKGRVMGFTNTINNTSSGELSNMMVEQFDNGLRLKQVS